MTKYRLKNFFNKEKETLYWIDNFNKNSIFFDIEPITEIIQFMHPAYILKLKKFMLSNPVF